MEETGRKLASQENGSGQPVHKEETIKQDRPFPQETQGGSGVNVRENPDANKLTPPFGLGKGKGLMMG